MSGWEWFVCVVCANFIIGMMLVSASMSDVWKAVNADGNGRRGVFIFVVIWCSAFAAPRLVYIAMTTFRDALAERRK